MPKARFGVEKRIIQPAPEITESDVITQTEACRILGVKSSTIIQGMDRGRYTVVWDLAHDGTGRKSARILLRAEIEGMARGELERKTIVYRRPPVADTE